jgi:hypothetical protein
MDFRLVTGYPLWFIIFCLALAGGLSYWLYHNDQKFKEAPVKIIKLLTVLRFITLFIISFLLLSPMVKTISQYIEKPVIIIAQDNSESITINKDSVFYKKKYPAKLAELISKISQDYDVNTYTFGERLSKTDSFTFKEKYTDFSDLFDELYNKYSNRNVGALILASDGIYNKGINPVYAASAINYPIYTVALGDSGTQKDIIISQVRCNKMAFLGNKFPMRVFVEVKDLKGIATTFKVIHKKNVIFTKDINVNNQAYSENIDIELDANESGLQHYQLQITPHQDEISTRNNYKDVIIDVIDSKLKILIVYNSPHPDIGAMREVLELNKNFAVDFFPIDKFMGKVKDYNLVIMHQLPSITNSANNLLSELYKNNIPILFILGGQSSIGQINNLKTGLTIQVKGNFEEAQVVYNKNFPLFELEEDMQKFLADAPPLIVPFGDYKTQTLVEVLFYQKIKNIKTSIPLILFKPENAANESKTGFIAGEGLWRWRLFDFRNHSNHDMFNELINKIVQYMALKVKKDNFNVIAKSVYNENEVISIEAEVYNESFELINDAEVSIEIINSQNNKFPFVFSPDKTGTKDYHLDAGIFPTGDYSYIATAKVKGKEYKKQGRFSILTVDFETGKTIANHQLLYQLSQKNQGKMFLPQQLDSISAMLKSNKNIVPVYYSEKNLREVINLKWIFIMLLLFLSGEWFIRKYYGSY